jgi:hypothetical protein
MNRADIEPVINALDAAVPKDDARVVIRQYGGGPDECAVIANERGYLRLGIEFLKAAYGPPVPGNNPASVRVDLDYVLSEDSEVQFDWFERRDPDAPVPTTSDWRDLAGMALGLSLVGVFIVGCGTVGKWAYDLFIAVL